MSDPSRKKRDFIPSGVPGLDHVLRGGFLREGFYLLRADPGSGKTTVALQYVLGRLKTGEPCLSRHPDRVPGRPRRMRASHGWSIDGPRSCGA